MIRSNRALRRVCTVFVAMLALAVVAPAGALAQSVSPTDEQYEQGVVGVAAGGNSGGDGTEPGNAGVSGDAATSSASELPFTGLDVAAIALIGVGLVGAGFAIRRAARTGDRPLA